MTRGRLACLWVRLARRPDLLGSYLLLLVGCGVGLAGYWSGRPGLLGPCRFLLLDARVCWGPFLFLLAAQASGVFFVSRPGLLWSSRCFCRRSGFGGVPDDHAGGVPEYLAGRSDLLVTYPFFFARPRLLGASCYLLGAFRFVAA